MLINGINAKDTYGAVLMDGYIYTPPIVETSYFKGRKTSLFRLLESAVDMGKMTLPITFQGENIRDVTLRKSSFDALIYPKIEIQLEDGFMYMAILKKIGDASYLGKRGIRSQYEFDVLRHTGIREVTGNEVFCDFTYPYVACDIKVTVVNDSENYKIGTVNFPKVEAGQIIEVDGINGRILIDGAPAAQYAEWTEFPILTPGRNVIECDDVVTLKYYPIYL